MTTIATTALDAIGALFVARIEATTPRLAYQGATAWKHYKRAQDSPGKTRWFTLRWGLGGFKTGGYFTAGVEHEVTLAVRVDYNGDHSELTPIIQDDWSQLRDRLHQLGADPANGVVLVLPTPSAPVLVADSTDSRQRLSNASLGTADSLQIDLTYLVRYQQATAAA